MINYYSLDGGKNLFYRTKSIVEQAKAILNPFLLTNKSLFNQNLALNNSPCKSQDRYIYKSRILKELKKLKKTNPRSKHIENNSMNFLRNKNSSSPI